MNSYYNFVKFGMATNNYFLFIKIERYNILFKLYIEHLFDQLTSSYKYKLLHKNNTIYSIYLINYKFGIHDVLEFL